MKRGLPLWIRLTTLSLFILSVNGKSLAQHKAPNSRLHALDQTEKMVRSGTPPAAQQARAAANNYYVNDLVVDAGGYTTTPGNDLTGTGASNSPFRTINRAIQQAASGDIIYVDAGIYTENVFVSKSLTINGRQASQPTSTRYAAFVANKANPTVESVIMPSQNNPLGGNPNANDLVRVLADNITINGFTIDGNNPLLGTSSVVDSGTTYIHARRGITNIDKTETVNPVSGLTVNYNIIQNVTSRGISLRNTDALAATGNSIDRNLFRTFGSDPVNGGHGVFLANNAYSNVTNNTFYVPTYQVGIDAENFSLAGGATWSGNNVTVSQSALGINANLFNSSASLTISSNTVNASPGITEDAEGETWGINAWSMLGNSTLSIQNNTVGASGGQFAHGINLWNLPTANSVTVSGGTVGNSVIGVDLDNVDPFYGGGLTTVVNVSGVAISGGSMGVRSRVTTISHNPYSPTATNAVKGSCTMNLSNVTINGASTGSVSSALATVSPYFARINFNSPASSVTGANVPVLINGEQAQVQAGTVNLTVPSSGANNAIQFQNFSNSSAISNLILAGGLTVDLNNNPAARAFSSPFNSIVEMTGAWTAPTPTAIGAPNSVFINGKLYFTNGILNSGGSSIEFGTSASDIMTGPKPEINTSYLLGQALMQPRPVGQGPFDFLGVVLDNAGSEGNSDVGSLTIGRTTTTGPINPPYPNNASIKTVWQITPTNLSASRGSVHFRYLDALKNFQNPNNIFAYRYTGGAWQRISASLMSTRVGDIYTTTAFAVPGFSSWTLSSDIPPIVPDLTPTVEIQNSTYTAQGQSKDFIVNVNEIAGGTTSGDNRVTVFIVKSTRFNYTFNGSQTTANYFGPEPVNNSDYEVVSDDASVLQLRTKAGVSIGANSTSKVSITIQLKTGDNTSGVVNQQVVLTGGGETNAANNSVNRILAISL